MNQEGDIGRLAILIEEVLDGSGALDMSHTSRDDFPLATDR